MTLSIFLEVHCKDFGVIIHIPVKYAFYVKFLNPAGYSHSLNFMFVYTHFLSILHKLPKGQKLQILKIQIIDLNQNEVTYDHR